MGHRITFAYDAAGNLSDVTDPDDGVTHYDYDAVGRMTSVTNPFSEITAYEYSPGGRLLKRVLGNDCVTYYSYDAIGQVSKADNRQADLSVISSFEYERDPRGNPTKIVREDGYTTYYEYDAKSQLTRETHRDGGQTVYAWEWDYDTCGNRSYQVFNGVQTDYTYNLANQLTEETSGGVTTYYKYDRSGNTISKQETGGATYYHWDHGNHLTQIDQPGDVHSYFTYDGDGKRVTKQDAAGFTRFVYQGPDMLGLLQERDEADELVAQYTMGNGLEAMRRGGASRFYHYDWLGSTFELTDEEGAVTDEYLYDAWGNALAPSGATPNPHRYVGKLGYYTEPQVALHHLMARWYSPHAGMFLSVDPLPRRQDGPYLYCQGVPTSRTDPSGLADWVAFWGSYDVEVRNLEVTADQIVKGHHVDRMKREDFSRRSRILLQELVEYFRARGWKHSAEGYQRYLNKTGGTMTIPWDRVNHYTRFLGYPRYQTSLDTAGAAIVQAANRVECGNSKRISVTFMEATDDISLKKIRVGWLSPLSEVWKYKYGEDVDMAILLGHYAVDFEGYSVPRAGGVDNKEGNMRWAFRTYLDPAGARFNFSDEKVPPLPIPLLPLQDYVPDPSTLKMTHGPIGRLPAAIPRAMEILQVVKPFGIASEKRMWIHPRLLCKKKAAKGP